MVGALDHKLLRDLWRMKGQAIAIGLVIGMGVALQVMMSGLVATLGDTRQAYYDRFRMAEVYAPVTRAPSHLTDRLAQIPGVAAAEGRVSGDALIDIPGQALPMQARAVSLPDIGMPRLNAVHLTDGRMISAARGDEILLLDTFARANGLGPGDQITATMNGARHSFRITGLALGPEFVYVTPPGELMADDARYGVIWMSSSALSAAYDMKGAFNEALISLTRNAREAAVIAAADRILAPYGGRGAYGLDDHMSNRFLNDEITQLKTLSRAIPPIFLGVSAFLLYIVISRMIQAEREEIGLMKAFGYSDGEVVWHYLKFVIVIAAGGALVGCLLGILLARLQANMYLDFFKFPFLLFRQDPVSFVIGVSVSVLTASAGGLIVLRRVFALTPATAMRPPAPADYSRAGRYAPWLARILDQPSRMVLRRLTRHPMRMAGATVGIACGMALNGAMLTLFQGFDRTIDLSFSVMDRSDLTLVFTHAVSQDSISDLRRLRGVTRVEPARIVPVVLRNGVYDYRGALSGLDPDAHLVRAMNADLTQVSLPDSGIVLSTTLADLLQVRPGDLLEIDVREGRQPLLSLPVVALSETLLGATAHMDRHALNRALGEPLRVSGAFLAVDPAQADAVYAALRGMPTVAGVSRSDDSEQALQDMMNEGAGATRFVMAAIAFVIAFGVVYNAARIAHAERERDLSSLRVIGFSRGEAAFVLLGELGAVVLAALPLGVVLGHVVAMLMSWGFSNENYQIPAVFSPSSHGAAALVVVSAALLSGWLVKRDIDRADLVSALKTRE
mgnify:FL=1